MRKLGWTVLTKLGILTLVVGTYSYHSELKKIDYNIFHRNQPAAEKFYQNPPILNVEWHTNHNGELETYLVNSETGKKIEILYDMMPKNGTMIKTMLNRFNIEDVFKRGQEPKSKISVSKLEGLLEYQTMEGKK